MAAPRILITRAPHQSSELAEHLRLLGAEPVLIPTIELTAPTSFESLDGALTNLATFDWLLFTSANAVEAFYRRAALHSISLVEYRALKIAAIGPTTAKALGITPTLMPPQAVAESLAEALLPYAKPGTRFLLVRAEQARDHLPDTLRAAGVDVTIAPAYRTITPAGSAEALRELFRTPASYPDAITFTSSSTATNLISLLNEQGIALPPEVRRVSIGPITSQTLRDLGVPPHA